jgi:hypothetical protein
MFRSLPGGHPLLNPFTRLRGRAWQHDHLRAAALRVVRAFVQMREALATNEAVLRRLAEIDKTLLEHDAALRALWGKLRPLLAPPPEPPAKEMGFHTKLRKP